MAEEIMIDCINVAGCYWKCKDGDCAMYYADLSADNNEFEFGFNCEDNPDCYYKQLKRLEQENKELSFTIEKCLENAGIECDDEEQALRSLPMLGTAHYKVLIEKEKLEQESKELKEKLENIYRLSDIAYDKILNSTEVSYGLNEIVDIQKIIKDDKTIYYNINTCDTERYRSVLKEIRENLVKLKTNDEDDFTYEYSKIEDKINGVLE